MFTVVFVGLLVLVVWLLVRGFSFVVATALAIALIYTGTLPLDPLSFLNPYLRTVAINATPEVSVVPRETPPGEPLDISPVFPEPKVVPPPMDPRGSIAPRGALVPNGHVIQQ
jgi:hypothetical protein